MHSTTTTTSEVEPEVERVMVDDEEENDEELRRMRDAGEGVIVEDATAEEVDEVVEGSRQKRVQP